MPTAAVALLLAAKPVEGQGWIGHWSPGIGDPSVMGWVTVALYLVAAWLCFLCSRRSRVLARRASGARWEPRLWGLFALFLLALGVNKQLDLQSAFEPDRRRWSRAFLELAGSAPDFGVGDRTAEHERGDVLNGTTADPSGPGRRKSLRMTGRGRGGSCR